MILLTEGDFQLCKIEGEGNLLRETKKWVLDKALQK